MRTHKVRDAARQNDQKRKKKAIQLREAETKQNKNYFIIMILFSSYRARNKKWLNSFEINEYDFHLGL